MNRQEIEEALSNCELFCDLAAEDIRQLATLCEVKPFRAGEPVFRQGDLGQHLYIVLDGHVLLQRSVDLGHQKGHVAIGLLGSGRVFGCWSTLLDQPHNLMASAVCQKPTRVLVMNGKDLRRMMVDKRELGFDLLEKLCVILRDRIRSAYGAMEKI
ncbi:Crp/Fnr family transcriptional regulator [Desulfatiglans anilini]|uniref:Crp/Fnr family transcriptional regulator n=1 Tax=Desulfatiglans anilini TaxID=90728 RepID=UPI0004250145|nr:cyclic nucleotide-binding domain-containing protein [Desulfatiglans anilini]